MSSGTCFCAATTLALLTACSGEPPVGDAAARAAKAPTSVSCADAEQLRQRAADDRRESAQLKSDQAKVSTGARANFLASLAIVADLKCKVTLAESDDALRAALETAAKAEVATSFYERTYLWGEADFKATQAASLLIRLTAQASK